MDSTRHTDHVALITGAASGIGLATVQRLTAEGATVVGLDRNAPLDSDIPSGTFMQVDITDGAALAAAVNEVIAAHGRIDILGNVAGINDAFLAAHEVDDDTWDTVMAINTTAVMRLCRLVLPGMMERGGGAIVNIASIAGIGGGASGFAYTASKHTVVGMTRNIAFAYQPEGIRCNAICPGGVRTNILRSNPAKTSKWGLARAQPFHALGTKLAEPDEIAALLSWLASSEASNLNGAIITADGGWTAG